MPLSWQKTSPQKESFARIFKKIFRRSKNIFLKIPIFFAICAKNFARFFDFLEKISPKAKAQMRKFFQENQRGLGCPQRNGISWKNAVLPRLLLSNSSFGVPLRISSANYYQNRLRRFLIQNRKRMMILSSRLKTAG